jgi:hypothetical protein
MAASKEHSNSCAYWSSLRSRLASASSLAGMRPVSLALSMRENQSCSDCERRHSSKKALRPLGVPMKTAQPCRSAKAGRMISDHTRFHVGEFVEHDAVEVDAAQRVGIVGAVKPHLPAVGIIDAQLGFVHARPDRAQRRHGRAQIVPRHRLRLPQERREVGEPRPDLVRLSRAALQVVDAGHRLAGAAVRHDAGEARGPVVEGSELSTLYVVDDELGCWHGIVICSTAGGHASSRRARCVRDAWTPFRCAARVRPSLPGLTAQSIGVSQNSYALWKNDQRRGRAVAQAIIPCRCPVEDTAAPERRSTRSFGEYVFLEDSRYASQPKNVSV